MAGTASRHAATAPPADVHRRPGRPTRLLAGLALALAAATVTAQERILDFASEILVAADGSMSVTETIRVRAEGRSIRRGIFRDFPTDYRDRFGNRYRVDFDVLGVTRDGAPEPWFTERRSNGVRVYVGSADVFLEPAEYEYRLRYRTDYQLGFFPDHDELYWNVTGNGWDFAIENAGARVVLPDDVGTSALRIEGFTGRTGSTEQAVRTAVVDARTAMISSTRTLAPREGLTLVLSWPKGVVAEPTAAERFARLLAANLGLLLALGCLAVVATYFVAVWRRYGRDPDPGPIFPHYEPPDGVSPAAARHIGRMGYDRKAFTAAVLSLAVKNHLEIEENDDVYTLRALPGGTEMLSIGERVLRDRLFARSDAIVLEKGNHRALLRAITAHGKALKRENYRVYFVTNRMYLLPALAVIVGTFVAMMILDAISPFAIATLVVAFLLVPIFAWLLKAPTNVGRRLLDRIEGFRLYLDVAEKDDLELRNPPEKTPELFEAYLPYALALDVEQHWAEQFNDVFAKIRAETGKDWSPSWYRGYWAPGMSGRGVGAMTAAMTGALGSAIASAATPPGSTSGGGGGGFSGGGGGGGGGGGW